MCLLIWKWITPEVVIQSMTALITAVYAVITYSILKQSKAQQDSTMRPYIVIEPFLKDGSTAVFLKVSNKGKTGAKNLKITVDEDFYSLGNRSRNIKDWYVFKETIAYFPAGSELVFFLESGSTLFSEENKKTKDIPALLNFKVEYLLHNGKPVVEKSILDLSYLENVAIPESDTVKSLAKIDKALQGVIKELKSMNSTIATEHHKT